MELTPEQLEKLRIAEEAHYLDLEEAELLETNNAILNLKDSGPEMKNVFTDDQILELAKAEEAYYADMDMAEISSESAKPTSLSRAEQKLKTFEKAKKTALTDAERKTNLSVGTVVNTSKTNTLVDDTVKSNLEAAVARGKTMDPIDDLIDYGDDFINFRSFDDEIDYTDEVYRGMIKTKPVVAGSASAARATPSVITTTSRSSTTKNIIKGVETATDLVSFNKKTAAAAAGLGLAGGYFANRKTTKR